MLFMLCMGTDASWLQWLSYKGLGSYPSCHHPMQEAAMLWARVYRYLHSASLLTVMLSGMPCARQAMTADDQQRVGAATLAGFKPPTKQPSALLGMGVADGPQQRCADSAAVEALRQLQLTPTTLHTGEQPEAPCFWHGLAADTGDCNSLLSPEAVAKLCCDDDESPEQQQEQEQHCQVGSPQSVLGLLHVSRDSSADGGDGRVSGRRTLPASGLGCGIFGASAVWGL